MSPLGAPGELDGFPAFTPDARSALWRIHRRDRSPWWFASEGLGRFDLARPRGTCYLAEDPLGAFVEVFRAPGGVGPRELAAVGLARLRPPRGLRLADTTVARARRFGVTLELSSTPDYTLTRAWARALADAGFDGVRHRLRHDPSGALLGVALFGAAGEAPWRWTSRTIPDDVLTEARRRFGILVLPGSLA